LTTPAKRSTNLTPRNELILLEKWMGLLDWCRLARNRFDYCRRPRDFFFSKTFFHPGEWVLPWAVKDWHPGSLRSLTASKEPAFSGGQVAPRCAVAITAFCCVVRQRPGSYDSGAEEKERLHWKPSAEKELDNSTSDGAWPSRSIVLCGFTSWRRRSCSHVSALKGSDMALNDIPAISTFVSERQAGLPGGFLALSCSERISCGHCYETTAWGKRSGEVGRTARHLNFRQANRGLS